MVALSFAAPRRAVTDSGAPLHIALVGFLGMVSSAQPQELA